MISLYETIVSNSENHGTILPQVMVFLGLKSGDSGR